MKKFITILALAVVPFLFTACGEKSMEGIVYEMGLRLDGGGRTGVMTGEAYKVYEEIENSLSAFQKETWSETVEDNDFSAADAKAEAKYEAKLQELKKVEAEAKQKVDALTDKSFTFTIANTLYLRRVRSGEDKYLEEYSINISNK